MDVHRREVEVEWLTPSRGQGFGIGRFEVVECDEQGVERALEDVLAFRYQQHGK